MRFAQYGVLRAIASSNRLQPTLVFKGGNALDFVWSPNRSTIDLDFSSEARGDDATFQEANLRSILAQTLASVGRSLTITYAVQSFERRPPGEDRSFPTIACKVGYALPDQPRLQVRLTSGGAVSQVVRVEMSLNEVICDDEPLSLAPLANLRVATLDDIVAEKLRALLQQTVRRRHRAQDLLDIAVVLSTPAGSTLEPERIGRFLIAKSLPRGIEPTKRAFRDPDLVARARVDYAALQPTTRNQFIDFEDAVGLLTAFVDQLALPE